MQRRLLKVNFIRTDAWMIAFLSLGKLCLQWKYDFHVCYRLSLPHYTLKLGETVCGMNIFHFFHSTQKWGVILRVPNTHNTQHAFLYPSFGIHTYFMVTSRCSPHLHLGLGTVSSLVKYIAKNLTFAIWKKFLMKSQLCFSDQTLDVLTWKWDRGIKKLFWDLQYMYNMYEPLQRCKVTSQIKDYKTYEACHNKMLSSTQFAPNMLRNLESSEDVARVFLAFLKLHPKYIRIAW